MATPAAHIQDIVTSMISRRLWPLSHAYHRFGVMAAAIAAVAMALELSSRNRQR